MFKDFMPPVAWTRPGAVEEMEAAADLNLDVTREFGEFKKVEPDHDPTPMETLSDILAMCDVKVTPEELKTWSQEQIDAAGDWAARAYLRASDNDDVVVPPKPEFLKAYPRETDWSDAVDMMGRPIK